MIKIEILSYINTPKLLSLRKNYFRIGRVIFTW